MKRTFLPLLIVCFTFLAQRAWADNYVISSLETNMTHYAVNVGYSDEIQYSTDLLKDGSFDANSKFWSNISQAEGQYITADLGEEKPLQVVKLYFAGGDQPDGGTVSISSDNSTWEVLGVFTSADIDATANYLVEINAANKNARYVRFENTNPNTSVWFQMTEIEIPIPDPAAPERTIAVSVSDETMGKTYIGVEGTVSATQTGIITLTAVANDGYVFTGWTLNGVQVSADAEFMDNTEGDKNYVANFVLDVYSQFGKPGISAGGNKRAQSKGEILNATGVEEGSTLVFNLTGNNNYQAWSNFADVVKVQAGATFDLKVTYGIEGWNDLSVFMMRSTGTNSLLYGPYLGAWTEGGNTANIYSRINEADDVALADVANGTMTFPIALPSNLAEGEVVLIRFLIHGSAVGDDPCTQNIVEGNYCDYLFSVVKSGSATGIKAVDDEWLTQGDDNALLYDLSGRRVLAPTKGGIYIKHGKKIVY